MVIHVVFYSMQHSCLHLDMVETRGIRKARESLNRNRFRARLEERIKDSYYYSITYHHREEA